MALWIYTFVLAQMADRLRAATQVQMVSPRSILYTTDMEELLQIAKSRITRQLTAEKKEKYRILDLN